MTTASTTQDDASPRTQQQRESFQRHNSDIDERIRSSSGSFAVPGGHADDDASMSNDESMSSTSSSPSSSRRSFPLQCVDSDQVLSHATLDRHRTSRTNSLEDFARQLPYLQDTSRQATDGHCGSPHRATTFSFVVTDSVASASITAPSHPMWLLTQFAPAMSKTIKSADPSADMEDDEPFDEEIEKNHVAQTANCQASGEHKSGRVGNRRVAWASSNAHVELPEGVRLTCARNEVAGVQLRLKSNAPFLLTTDKSNWMLPLGHGPRARVAVDTRFVPPHKLTVEVFVVGYVEDENADLVMETLQRTGVSSKAAREHTVYLRIRIAETLEPGVYELPLRVFTQEAGFRDEELTWSSSVVVSVVDVQLPAPPNWRFRLDLWQHWTAVARAHCVALWSNRHFELIDRYMAPLSEMGQKCLSVVATEMPWAGQQCYMEEQNASALFEQAILDVYEDPAHGVPVTVDFTHFDRLLALAACHHLDHEIEVFGLLSVWRDPAAGFDAPAELTVRHLQPPPVTTASTSEAHCSTSLASSGLSSPTASSSIGNQRPDQLDQDKKNEPVIPPPSPSTSSPQALAFVIDGWRIRCQDRTTQRVRYLRQVSEVEAFIEQFYAHCEALEIADRVRICADEPRNVAVFHEQLRFIERLAPNFRIKLAVNHSEFFSPAYAPPQVADYVPLLPLACADLEVTRRLANNARARGGHVCWYVCCGPAFPNQFVSSPLVEGELVGYLTFFFELDGFLRWNYCLWPARPWDDLRWRSSMWKVGDMYFVLPGHDGWPVETLRLESMRFAGQAFELLALAKKTLSPVQMQQLQRVVAEQILRSSDLEEFGRYTDRAREDLYSLDPLDYQRARTIILNTLAEAAVKGGKA
uniref:Glycoside hydrolase 123 catalytic domain-containing protein n=1 Tax=Hyaloperonospora arabidopsidis (strain Emoy2) TaxID=559515 RepID=M4BZB4_HYAAE